MTDAQSTYSVSVVYENRGFWRLSLADGRSRLTRLWAAWRPRVPLCRGRSVSVCHLAEDDGDIWVMDVVTKACELSARAGS